MLLVSLSFVIWSFTLRGSSRWIFAIISIATTSILVTSIGQNVIKISEPTETISQDSNRANLWQPWSVSRVEKSLAAGQPVFVDFTAAWCVTCQYNKKTTLANSDVLADMQAKKVLLLRADWTRRDPAITAALQQLGRSGVPVYVLYNAGHPPVVLSESIERKRGSRSAGRFVNS